MVLADMDHARCLPSDDLLCLLKVQPKGSRSMVVHWVLVLIAVFLLSMPEYDEAVESSFGYITLSTTLTPKEWSNHWGPGRFWPCLAAMMLVAVIDHAGADSVF